MLGSVAVRRGFGGLAMAGLLCLSVGGNGWVRASSPPSEAPIGVASCSTLNCHGGPDLDPDTDPGLRSVNGRGDYRRAYTVWFDRDPHSKAFSTLYDARSRRIVHWLEPKSADDPMAYRRVLDVHCASCHAPSSGQSSNPVLIADGVGCEACHGAAAEWVKPHVEPGWMKLRSDEKHSKGMWPTEDLTVRAGICASCHVGDPKVGREMNHDLLGAGHPRLQFDFFSHLNRFMQGFAHWDVEADRKFLRRGRDGVASMARDRNFDLESWAVGQLVSAKATVDQLSVRAARANSSSEPGWPEFSDYDCYACHQPLESNPERRPRWRAPMARPGAYVRGNWYASMARFLGTQSDGSGLPAALDGVASALGDGMRPNPFAVQEASAKASTELAEMIEKKVLPEARELLRRLVDLPVDSGNWDDAAQWYFAVVALAKAVDIRSGSAEDALASLRDALEFSENFESPWPYDGADLSEKIASVRTALKSAK